MYRCGVDREFITKLVFNLVHIIFTFVDVVHIIVLNIIIVTMIFIIVLI